MMWIGALLTCAAGFLAGYAWARSPRSASRDTHRAAQARYFRDLDAAAARLVDDGVANPWDAPSLAAQRLTQDRQARAGSTKKLV